MGITQDLESFHFLIDKISYPDSKNILKTVLSSFEMVVLQQSAKLCYLHRLKQKLSFFLFEVQIKLEGPPGKYDVLIWPVQLIHLDFLIPVYKSLVDLGLQVSFINYRDDISEHIKMHNADLIKVKMNISKKLKLRSIMRGFRLLSIILQAKSISKSSNLFSSNVEKALYEFRHWEIYSKVFDEAQKAYAPKYQIGRAHV